MHVMLNETTLFSTYKYVILISALPVVILVVSLIKANVFFFFWYGILSQI